MKSASISGEVREILRALGPIEMIDRAAECELVARVRQGDGDAFAAIIRSQIAQLVRSAVRRNRAVPGAAIGDLVSAGIIGLKRAVDKYDVGHEARLYSYSKAWVSHFMQRELYQKTRLICVPIHAQEEARRHQKGKSRRYPFPIVVSGESQDDSLGGVLSLIASKPIEHAVDMEVAEEIRELSECLEAMPSQESDVLRKVYGIGLLPMTHKEIGDELGCHHNKVRYIVERAKRRLRVMMEKDLGVAS